VTVLTVALEVGLLGASGVDVNPLHIAGAQAQVGPQAQGTPADSPPDTSGADCDNDNDAGTDIGEIAECFALSARDFLAANEDLIFYALAGLAAGVLIIGVGLLLAPEIFATAGLIATFGTASELFPVVYFSSEYYVLSTALAGEGAFFLGAFGYIAETESSTSRARAAAQTSDIALPAPVAVRLPSAAQLVGACRRVRHKARCRAVALATRRYALALSQTASVAGALAITVKRLHHSVTDPARLTGTAKVLSLRMLNALTAQQTAARALARELRRAHIHLRLSASQVRRALAALRSLKNIPKSVLLQLEKNLELSKPELAALFRRTLARSHIRARSYDFVKELERPLPTTGLRESYESLTIAEMGRLLYQLNYEKRISKPDTLTLVNDVLTAQRACSPLQRRGPMGKFVADVRAHVKGPYAQFLQEAAVPLFGNHPYPNNKPPTAGFTPLERTSRVSAGHPLHAIFRDTSDDKADGGHAGCWEWNFGDPSSGSANVSFLRNPTHDYAEAGTYTVSLTAIDDDGFASNTTTGRVTATP
jgi:hypothetical protein